jgi:DNA topoisomerase-1
MSDYLVIVESPAKAKTIRKYLGDNYKIAASMGHIRDLPQSHLGVDINNDFDPMYIAMTSKRSIIKTLKKEAEDVKQILLATDPDREGEAISWHLSHILKIDPQASCRITFNEITKDAVINAVKNPRTINMNLVDAQQARRVLDRIVGYEISPVLWKKVRKGLSAGRVQSVATKIICDREREIEDFVPEEYWTIETQFRKSDGLVFTAGYRGENGKKKEIKNKTEADNIVSLLNDSDFIVSNVKKRSKTRNPAPPFITSTLQQEASRKLGFSAQKTMLVAQQLYEGVELGDEGSVGLITYMRTDSVRISNAAVESARAYIKGNFGNDYLPEKPRYYKTKSASQDAHEAIRPTYIERDPESLKNFLAQDQYKLYKLIWDRFIACQMESAVYDTLTIDIEGTPRTFREKTILNLRATGSKLIFKGFMSIYVESSDDEEDETSQLLPAVEENEKLSLIKIDPVQHFTQPPPRYTEATLVKTLEELGIGRPSTYAPTISTIISRGYVERNKRQLVPTELGKIVNQFMAANFADIVNTNFTAEMESKLDKVEIGELEWKELLRNFYEPFKLTIKNAESINKVEIPVEYSDVVCDKCGKTMVIKTGRFGKFLACPGFPECKNTKPFVEEAGVKCPKCKGKVIIRKTKRGKEYLGCENYPKCDFMNWNMPSDKICPNCSSFLTQKAKTAVMEYKCANPDCDYSEEVAKEGKTSRKRKAKKEAQSEQDKK